MDTTALFNVPLDVGALTGSFSHSEEGAHEGAAEEARENAESASEESLCSAEDDGCVLESAGASAEARVSRSRG